MTPDLAAMLGLVLVGLGLICWSLLTERER